MTGPTEPPDDSGLELRLVFTASDNTTRAIVQAPHWRERQDVPDRLAALVPDAFVNERLKTAVDTIINDHHDRPPYNWDGYVCIITTPCPIVDPKTNRQSSAYIAFPLVWTNTDSGDSLTYDISKENYGRLATWPPPPARFRDPPAARNGTDIHLRCSADLRRDVVNKFGEAAVVPLEDIAFRLLARSRKWGKSHSSYLLSEYCALVYEYDQHARKAILDDFNGLLVVVD